MIKLATIFLTAMLLPTTYKANARIVESTETKTVFETEDGNLWETCGHRFMENSDVVLTFDNNGTEDIHDDIIVEIEVE